MTSSIKLEESNELAFHFNEAGMGSWPDPFSIVGMKNAVWNSSLMQALLASFPPAFTSGLWLLAVCEMEWEGLGNLVTCTVCDVMMVDGQGAVPDKESWGPSCIILSKNVVWYTRGWSLQSLCVATIRHCPTVCLSSVYLRSHTWLNFSRPFDPLHFSIDQKLEVEMA